MSCLPRGPHCLNTSPQMSVSRQTWDGVGSEEQRTEICLQTPCCFPDNQVQMSSSHQEMETGQHPLPPPARKGREAHITPGSGQKPVLGFPRARRVGEGPPGPAEKWGLRGPGSLLRQGGRAEACHLHLQPRSIFFWPCSWKLQLLAAAQAHLDGALSKESWLRRGNTRL